MSPGDTAVQMEAAAASRCLPGTKAIASLAFLGKPQRRGVMQRTWLFMIKKSSSETEISSFEKVVKT